MGHEAYLKTEASFDPEEEHQTSFHFSFSDFFHDFDESFVVDESHFQWSFLQDARHQRYSFEAPNGNFLFLEDLFEDEDVYYY